MMQFAFTRALLICALCAFAAAKQPQAQQQQQQSQLQPQPQPQQNQAQPTKLKRDAGLSFGSIYHGPSHKYLPPVASHGYESTYAQLHGNGLASSSGFDFASLDTESGHHGPQHHQQYHHQNHHHHYSHQPHTYQSLASHHGHGRPVYISSSSVAAPAAASYHHRPQAPKVETYIVQTSNSGAGHGHGHGHGIQSHSSSGGSSSGGYKYSGHGSSGFLSLLGGSSHKQHGGGHSSTYIVAAPTHNSIGGGSGASHGISFGHGYPAHGHGPTHFAPALEHEQHSSFNYEAPSVHFKQPLSSYGVPLLPGFEHSQHEEAADHHAHQEHQLHHNDQQLPAEKSHTDQTPAYALGHKGLGHFTYTSSKPLALNTEVHHQEDHNELVADLSKAPFKPSAFLGAKHEASAGYDYATPSTQFLQSPTAAAGYDYPAPAVLYGAPGQSGDSATPIFEPDSTYLPPLNTYGPPATPTHGYH